MSSSSSSAWLLLLVSLSVAGCDDASLGQGQPDARAEQDARGPDATPSCTADVSETFYADADGDGFGTPDLTAVDCVKPEGFVENDLDCDDGDSRSNPQGTELCDGLDNDCNAATVEVCPTACTVQKNAADIYLYCNQNTTHANATTICEGQGMHLVRIDSMEEQSFVSSQRNVAFGGRAASWIGGSDTATENVWVWADGTQFWQGRANGAAVGGLFTFWRGGEPNNDNNEDCAGLRNSDSAVGRWNDFGCGDGLRTICERDKAPL